MEESRLKQLRGLRNNEIISLAKQGLSVNSLSYLFNLSVSQIRQIVSDSLVPSQYVKKCSIEDLDNWRTKRKQYYLSNNLSPEEIDYIFHKGSLVQSEEIQSLKSLVISLQKENSGLKSKIESLNLDLKSNELDIERKDKKIKDMTDVLSKYKSYIEGMKGLESSKKELESSLRVSGEKIKELEYKINFYLKKISDLSSTLDSRSLSLNNMSVDLDTKRDEILSLKDSKNQLESELRASNNKINTYLKKIDDMSQLKEKYSNLFKLSQQQQKEISFLESGIKELNLKLQSYETELQSLKSEKTLLEEENKSLKSSLESKDKELDDSIKFLTPIQKQQIVDYYVSHNFRLTKKGLEEFISTTGIQISDSGFRFICKQKNVYRRKKKKK